jgi:hypothetical protein
MKMESSKSISAFENVQFLVESLRIAPAIF